MYVFMSYFGVFAFFCSVLLFFEDCFFKYILEKFCLCFSEKSNMDSYITFDFKYIIKTSKMYHNLIIGESITPKLNFVIETPI